ncbi:hypothetical protein [Jeotgalibacillus proteolyticus]|uniref:hypothetical protein n=1 Tax=Jeotgalibacillus proteolyticus TaxID=2082395 RepID=UPI003CEA846C
MDGKVEDLNVLDKIKKETVFGKMGILKFIRGKPNEIKNVIYGRGIFLSIFQ